MLGAELCGGQWRTAKQSAVLGPESMHRPVSSIFVALVALVSLACEEEPPPGFEDGSFGAAHREQIERDCDRRVMCAARTNPHLRSDAFDYCVTENAKSLNDPAKAAFRFHWTLGINRCFQEDACQYTDCVDSTYLSWGESQLPKITNICAQQKQCFIEMGTLGVSPQEFDETCPIFGVLAADMIVSDQRPSFTNAYFQCETLVSCAFDMCFPF
jgi:hypothetical protein